MMKAVSKEIINDCLSMDPIQTAELMTETNDFYYCPYIYGFSNYSRNNYRKNILKYIDVLDLSGKGPSGIAIIRISGPDVYNICKQITKQR